MKRVMFAAVAVLAMVVSAKAAPIVTMTSSTSGGNDVYDFYYTASQGTEFTTYELQVHTQGAAIQDPSKSATFDADGDAMDTWANTVSSLLGGGAPSYVFTQYKPTGIGSTPVPTADLNWTVFDTETGDGNSIPGLGQAPWHLARVLVTAGAQGTASINAFDSGSGTVGTQYNFTLGATIPEPATFALVGLSVFGVGFIRRR